MIKGKEILGRNIVAISNGQKIETVHDIVLDHQANQVLGLLVDEGGWFRAAKVVPFGRIRSFGEHAIMIADPSDVTSTREDGRLAEVLDSRVNLVGMALLTTDGQQLGRISDVYFDEQTGRVEGYDATGGLFADLSHGRTFVPAPDSVQIGTDAAIVPVAVAAAMQEQQEHAPGGLAGVFHGAAAGVKESVGHVAASVTGAGGAEGAAETGTPSGSVRVIMSAAPDAGAGRHKEYVIGKVAGADISLPDGTPVVRRGEVITAVQAATAERHGLLATVSAAATGGNVGHIVTQVYVAGVDRARGEVLSAEPGQDGSAPTAALNPSPTRTSALGRRVKGDVRAPHGGIVAAQGQIVTPELLGRAEALGVAGPLLDATADHAGPGETPTSGGAGLTESAGQLLGKARRWLSDRRDETEAAISEREQSAEEGRVRDALGRPVTRVILAPDDSIILNVGEIVTHRAIEAARAGDVLDILLGSVTREGAAVDPMATRPHESGKAALDSQADLSQPAAAEPDPQR